MFAGQQRSSLAHAYAHQFSEVPLLTQLWHNSRPPPQGDEGDLVCRWPVRCLREWGRAPPTGDELALVVKLVPDEVKIPIIIISTTCILGLVVGLSTRIPMNGFATTSMLFTLLASIHPMREVIRGWAS